MKITELPAGRLALFKCDGYGNNIYEVSFIKYSAGRKAALIRIKGEGEAFYREAWRDVTTLDKFVFFDWVNNTGPVDTILDGEM
jgi:hypothetical protein